MSGWASSDGHVFMVYPMPTARSGLAAVTGPDGRIYAIGGYAGDFGLALQTVEAYDLQDNRWTTAPPMPTARHGLAATVGSDGWIYAIGGTYGRGTVEAFSTTTQSWTTLAPLPTARTGLAAAAAQSNAFTPSRIYAIGGRDATWHPVGTVEAYRPIQNRWGSVAPMPTPRSGLAAVTGPDGRVYAIGGYGEYSPVATVERYDPARNVWDSLAPMPTARNLLAAATGPDGRIYAIGGFDRNYSTLSTVEAYDPATNTWTPMPPLPTPRFSLAAASDAEGRIYAIGGAWESSWDEYSSVATVELLFQSL